MLGLALILVAAAPADSKLETFLHSNMGGGTEGGIPRILIWGLVGVAPEKFGSNEAEFFERYGRIPDPSSKEGLPYGMQVVTDGVKVPYFSFNCAWCHVGKVGDQVLYGAGNRSLRQTDMTHDIVQMGRDKRFTVERMIHFAHLESSKHGRLWHATDSAEMAAAVLLIRGEAKKNYRSDTVVLGPALSIPSFIAEEKRMGIALPKDVMPAVKYPSIWSYGARTSFTCGANFVGDLSRAIMAPEYTKGRSVKSLLAKPAPFDEVYAWMLATAPPPYPFPFDHQLAEKGEEIYLAECQSCHGTNAQRTYRELRVPWEKVRTDIDRLRAYPPAFKPAFNALALGRVSFQFSDRYVAPQHDGLWARAPYLHNGSVPNLRAMLTPPEQRPKAFWVGNDVPYDPRAVGDRCDLAGDECAPAHEGLFRYDTREQGRGNRGHPFGTDLPDEDKTALIEYLKTL